MSLRMFCAIYGLAHVLNLVLLTLGFRTHNLQNIIIFSSRGPLQYPAFSCVGEPKGLGT